MQMIPLIVLLVGSTTRADILSRLQHLTEEPEPEPSGELNTLLAKELLNASASWIREETYYTRRGLSRATLEAQVSVTKASFKSDLRQRVTNIYLETEVTLRGKSFKYRDDPKAVHCRGVAALGADGVEWVLLDCGGRPTTATGVSLLRKISSHNWNFGTDGGQGLWKTVGESLERELEESLEQLVRRRFKAVLSTRSPLSSPYSTEDSNTLLDAAISLIVFVVKGKYNDSIKIPDIREGVRLNLLVLDLDTGLMASSGVARDVSSLRREGDARIERRNVTIHFAGALVFQRLNIEYEEYRAAVLGIGPAGRLGLSSEPVSVGLAVRLDFGQRRVFLDSFRIKTLGPTKLDITGLGRGRLLADLAEWFLNLVRNHILHFLERRIASYTREALSKNTIDQILTGEMQF